MTKNKDDHDVRFTTLSQLLSFLQIRDWDLLLVGDGSGVGWSHPIGCATVLIDRATGERKMFAMGMNAGTITVAEMMPYAYALLWYTSEQGPGKHRTTSVAGAGMPFQVHIITDSKHVADAGNHRQQRTSHRPIWAMFDKFASMGYQLRFHHVKRSRVDLNVWADLAAGFARQRMLEFDSDVMSAWQIRNNLPSDITLDHINP